MTILQAKTFILDYFATHDFITYEDLGRFIKTSDDKQACVSACLLALAELTSENIIGLNPIYSPQDLSSLVWNLRTPLPNITQKVLISGQTALNIASIVNSFADTVEAEELSANPLQIEEKDLSVVCDIVAMLSQNKAETDKQSIETNTKPKKIK